MESDPVTERRQTSSDNLPGPDRLTRREIAAASIAIWIEAIDAEDFWRIHELTRRAADRAGVAL